MLDYCSSHSFAIQFCMLNKSNDTIIMRQTNDRIELNITNLDQQDNEMLDVCADHNLDIVLAIGAPSNQHQHMHDVRFLPNTVKN